MPSHILSSFFLLCSCLLWLDRLSSVHSLAVASLPGRSSLENNLLSRQDDPAFRDDGPVFPDQPPSCPICEQNFGNINSCVQACPVLANFSMVIFNPGAFISVIQCACTDTFQSAYPQCVDCFTQTNQTAFLNVSSSGDVPGILTGIRNICALESTLLGNVSGANGEFTSTGTIAPLPTTTANGAQGKGYWDDLGEQRGLFFLTLAFALVFGHIGSLI